MTATYTYDPSGQQTSATGTSAAVNPLRYTQGLLDEHTGWLKHGVRFHDTTTANWSTQDQLSQLLRPDAASRYAYVGGDPANRIDPTGFLDDEDVDMVNDYSDLGGNVGGLIVGPAAAAAGARVGYAGGIPGAVVGFFVGGGVGYEIGDKVGRSVGTAYALTRIDDN